MIYEDLGLGEKFLQTFVNDSIALGIGAAGTIELDLGDLCTYIIEIRVFDQLVIDSL